jgi:RHS repeat-associated protein
VKEPGYAYLYVSNEHGSLVDVYIDDVSVKYMPSPVVQMDDYYPFGLTLESYQRENSIPNQYKFNGIERQDELDLNLDFAFYRGYNPSIGRWLQIDPKVADHESPYVGLGNNPLRYSDLLGDTIVTYEGRAAQIEQIQQADKFIAENSRLARRIMRRLEKSENVHNTREATGGMEIDSEEREIRAKEIDQVLKGEISWDEYAAGRTTTGAVLSESDIANFRNGNNRDQRDTDGTGTGSTMFVGVEAMNEGTPNTPPRKDFIWIVAHERAHQYHADKGTIDHRQSRHGNYSREEDRATRTARRIIRQINRNTDANLPNRRRYKD